MDFVRLGRSDLTVSRIAFGTWQLSGAWGEASTLKRPRPPSIRRVTWESTSSIQLKPTVLEAASNCLARRYAALSGTIGTSIVIATKGGVRDDNGRFIRDADPRLLRDGLEASLTALGVDYVDLFQVHWPDPRRPSEETAEVLREMVAEGKVRHVGVSNFSVAEIADLRRTGLTVGTLQPPYNLLNRAAEPEILPYCRENDIGALIYGPLAHGLLSGAFDERSVFGADDCAPIAPFSRGRISIRTLPSSTTSRRSHVHAGIRFLRLRSLGRLRIRPFSRRSSARVAPTTSPKPRVPSTSS